MVAMERKNQTAFAALATAGLLWGLTVPLSKLSLAWLGPAWLTVARFLIAAPVLAFLARRRLREAMSWRVAGTGALGFGGVILLQNAGVERTSVSHAALVIGAVPLLVALLAAALDGARVRPRAWSGFALALAGIALVAGAGGGGSSPAGDLLVFASAVLSAGFIFGQSRLLEHRDATAVTAVQFAAGGLAALPIAAMTDAPSAPQSVVPVAAFIALSLAGTLIAFWLFAFGQARVDPQLAGAFVNLEPLVGAAAGWLAFGNPATLVQLGGAVVVLVGIALSTQPATGRGALPERANSPERGDASERARPPQRGYPPERGRRERGRRAVFPRARGCSGQQRPTAGRQHAARALVSEIFSARLRR